MTCSVRQLVRMLSVVALMAVAGCSGRPLSVISPDVALPAGENSAEYIDRVASQGTVSEDDAFRGILMLVNGKDDAQTFDDRTKALLERKLVSENWTFRGDRPITRGKLAYMIYQACSIPGGVILTLTGPSQRYCLRELQYNGFLVQKSSFYGEVTGMEFVAVISRADTYLESGEIPDILSTMQGG